MFYENEGLALRITGVYRVFGKPETVRERGRRHTAISFRIKGNSTVNCQERSFPLQDGTLAYFPAGVDYVRTTHSDEEYVVIHLDAYGDIGGIIETVSHCESLAPIVESILTEWEKGGQDRRNRCMERLYRLFEELSKRERDHREEIPSSILPGVEYMREQFRSSALSIADLAKLCHVSETYFRRAYVACFGISPVQALLSLRFDYAKSLLRTGYYKTKEVAALSGFSDVKYFRTAFKKRFGITPVEYAEGKEPQGAAVQQKTDSVSVLSLTENTQSNPSSTGEIHLQWMKSLPR